MLPGKQSFSGLEQQNHNSNNSGSKSDNETAKWPTFLFIYSFNALNLVIKIYVK